MKYYSKFEDNMDNLQYNFQNFSPGTHYTEIAITA